MSALLVVLVAFVLMEGYTYLAHRFVMHGIGWVLHKSHHQALASRFEANDLFPVMFASVTVVAMAAGGPLLLAGAGVTLYGMAYMFVHDVYIHRRLGWYGEVGVLERLKSAHRIHHLYNGEPYGMLLPVVPKALRERAAGVERDPLARSVSAAR